MEEEIPLDDAPTEEQLEPIEKPTKKAPAYFDDATDYQSFDSGDELLNSDSNNTAS